MSTGEKPASRRERFRVPVRAKGFLAGVDPLKLNQLVDELAVDGFVDARTAGTPMLIPNVNRLVRDLCALGGLAIEHQAELQSNDSDFGRFSGLKWRNPIAAMGQ